MNEVVLKYVADFIVCPLGMVLNIFMDHGIFPESLKISKTVPIYKRGKPEKMGSYRPISIIPIFQIYETLVKTQLVNHFETNSLFSDPAWH